MSRASRSAWQTCLWLLAACSGRSIQLDGNGVASSGPGGAEVLLADVCGEVDAYRCSGPNYQRCTQTSDGSSWVTLAVCDSPALCGPLGGCVTPACQAAQRVCVGPILRRCNGDLTGFVDEELCTTAASCDPDGCRPQACEPGELRCNGRQLERCREDRSDWQLLEVCGQDQTCDRDVERCFTAPCSEGATQCDGRLLQFCASDPDAPPTFRLSWVTLQACATPELCDASDSSVPSCRPPSCALDQFSCSGSTLLRCNGSRTGWDVVSECADAASCSAGDGTCLEA